MIHQLLLLNVDYFMTLKSRLRNENENYRSVNASIRFSFIKITIECIETSLKISSV